MRQWRKKHEKKVIDDKKLLTDVENEGLKSTPIAVAIFRRYISERKKKRFKEAYTKFMKKCYEVWQ